uniref:GAF domain-containing protein n=1 Tax=Phenylobacterium sp. TaxID=1871053 RepID=UPI002FC8B3DF
EEPLEALTVPLGPAGGGLARAFLEKTDVCWNGEGPVPEGLRLHSPYAHLKPLRARIFANIPLVARGEAIGVIAAGNPETRRPIQEETRSFLRIFAAHAAIAIENARLYQSLKEHSATLEQRIDAVERQDELMFRREEQDARRANRQLELAGRALQAGVGNRPRGDWRRGGGLVLRQGRAGAQGEEGRQNGLDRQTHVRISAHRFMQVSPLVGALSVQR